MPLHLEISGDMTAKELTAVAALIEVLRGDAKPTFTVFLPETVKVSLPEVVSPPLIDTTEEFVRPEGKGPPPAVDSTGLPWDARIHAMTKTQKADGAWTSKRNVEADTVTQVTAELRANLAATGVPDDAPVFTDPAQAFGAVPRPPVEEPVAAVVPPPPAEEPAAASVETGGMVEFARLMRLVVEKQKAGSLSTEMASGIARQLGLTDMRGLATRPDLIPAFEALLP